MGVRGIIGTTENLGDTLFTLCFYFFHMISYAVFVWYGESYIVQCTLGGTVTMVYLLYV